MIAKLDIFVRMRKTHNKERFQMEVNIYFKDMKKVESYEFEETEFERLEKDFIAHAESKYGKPMSGSYTCQQYKGDGPERGLL